MKIYVESSNSGITHYYKDYEIVKNGTSEFPWNIYAMRRNPYSRREVRTHVGYARTLKDCKHMIDDGIFDDIIEDI